jgi:predicted nucleic acid-binding protein
MRFVDSNVFLHAFLIPRRELTRKEKTAKEEARSIVEALEAGEEAAMTAAHLSEVVNIIESGLGLRESLGFLSWAAASGNLNIFPVGREDYEEALPVAKEAEVSANDALAWVAMRRLGLTEIYSFDRHLDRLEGIRRLTSRAV